MANIKCSASEKLPAQHKSAWFGFIKSIATFRGDLSSLTAPPFLLSPQSIVEYSTYWCEHPSLFIAPALEPSPEKRALLVLQWFLSTLKQQHSNRDEAGKKKRMKPLNPFLGEIFEGRWEDGEGLGTTRLVAEQVSHHPPATACYVWNEQHGVRLQGHVAPKVYFSGTVHIDRKGYSLLHIDKYNEDYLITMPKIHVEGLMTGSLAPELSGTTFIRSSSGYTIKIEYLNKGWVRGTRNGFMASVFHDDNEKEVLYTVDGQWCDSWTTKGRDGKVVDSFDINELKRTPLTVAPLEEQHPLESRRAWRHVVDAIHRSDILGIGHEKSKIENEQREMRKREKSEGTDFPRRYFSRQKQDPVAEKLVEGIAYPEMKGEMDCSHGLWMWNEEKYSRIQENKRSGIKSPTRRRFDSGVGGMIIDEMESS